MGKAGIYEVRSWLFEINLLDGSSHIGKRLGKVEEKDVIYADEGKRTKQE